MWSFTALRLFTGKMSTYLQRAECKRTGLSRHTHEKPDKGLLSTHMELPGNPVRVTTLHQVMNGMPLRGYTTNDTSCLGGVEDFISVLPSD